jgi:hypothetical protein
MVSSTKQRKKVSGEEKKQDCTTEAMMHACMHLPLF